MKNKIAVGLWSVVLGGLLSAFSATYYVDASRSDDSGDGASWATAKKTIQEAVDQATTNDIILVTNGVYDVGGIPAGKSSLTNRVYVPYPMTVQSVNGPEVTSIVGAPGSNGSNDVDSIRGVYLGNEASLIGFTVTDGYTIGYKVAEGDDDLGGGLWMGSDAVVSNCVISGNMSDWSGGGVYMSQYTTLANCTVSGNQARSGGGVYLASYSSEVNDCVVSNNAVVFNGSKGGGLYFAGRSSALRCTIVNNTSDEDGGGVYSWDEGTLTECVISRNQAGDGAGAFFRQGMYVQGDLTDCLIEENEATVYGGGLYLGYNAAAVKCILRGNSVTHYGGGAYLLDMAMLDGCVLAGNTTPGQGAGAYLKNGGTLRNCTISKNAATGMGGGVRSYEGGTLQNTIVWDNTSDATGQDIAIYGKVPTIIYSCASDGLTHGTDNCRTNNPLFEDAANTNFQLTAFSPCVNTGDNNAYVTAYDIAGNLRQAGGTLDMGAYERPADPTFLITTTAGANGTLSPTNPIVTQGFNQTILIQPSGGYRIASLSVDSVSILPMVGSYTFTNVQATHEIEATFAANPDVLYVNSARSDDFGDGASWATAKKTIQAAVDGVASGGTVWVTNGTYDLGGKAAPGSAQANRVCITRPVTLRSVNGPEHTAIIGAAGSNGSNDVDSVRGVCMKTNSALIGFTVANGYSTSDDYGNNVYAEPGSGVWMTTGAVVSNCVITGNSSLAAGGGVNVYGGLLTHSTIFGNQSASGGGGVCLSSDGVMSDCVVSNNVDTSWNGGGGARLNYGGEIKRTVFKGNVAMSGGGVLSDRGGPLNNCLFVGNIASEAGGAVAGTEAVLNNCTIVGNSVTNTSTWEGGGGVAAVMSGMMELNNCVVWGNTSPTNSNLAVGSWDTVRNTCVPVGEGITNGVDGCVTSDPLFVSATNYQLQVSSPCVNAGTNAYAPAGTDLAGNTRINNGTVDMGAYEQTTVLLEYVITTDAGANGMMLPTNPSVFQGSEQRITIHPQVAYKIDTLTVDGSPIAVTNEYTFTNVQSAHTIAATFALDPHALSVTSGSGDGSYTNAAIVPVSADSAALGMAFSHWTVVPVDYVSGLASTSSASTTFVMPQAEVELVANYKGTVTVQNVSVAQRPGTKLVDISYDVFSGATNAVTVSLSLLDGASNVTAATLSGDVGSGVAIGAGKSILWNAGADWNGQVAALSFDVSASAGSLVGSDIVTHSVDSRNYTLTVNSSPEGGYGKLSKKGYYSIMANYGSVESTTAPVVRKTSGSRMSDWEFSSYASASEGMPYRFEYLPNTSVSGIHLGANEGYGCVQVDPKTGTIKTGAQAHNRGGPTHWRDSGGDLHQYSSAQSSWGFGDAAGGVRRIYEVTGTAPFYMTLNETFEGEFDTEEDTSAYFRSISFVSRIKDRDTYFGSFEMNWGGMTDMAGDINAYDWAFGGSGGADVAEFLLQTGFERESGNDTNETRDVSGEHHVRFLVNPGDLIVVDNWMRVAAATKNPVGVLDDFSERRARADQFVLTSELSMEGGSGGGANDYAYFDWQTIGNPVPDTGTHSNYCWMSVVTCSVESVEGYVNTGWVGTGSVPSSGSSSTTGAITLSNLNSSISWEWELGGYPLTVNIGTGSGNYTSGDIVAISADDPVGFHHWEGDHVYDLADPSSSSTTIKMPSASVELTPVYAPLNAYVDASMTNNSLSGTSWASAKKTIQAGVDIVAENGTVWVTNGVYNLDGAVAPGGVITNRVCITRPITVRSVNGADVTTIVGDGWFGDVRGVYMTNGCLLTGFTVREGNAGEFGGGIFLTENCVADSCVVVSNWAGHLGGGVYLSGGGELIRSVVRGNSTDVYGSGVGMSGGAVHNCLITENLYAISSDEASGVYMEDGELNNSTIVSNFMGVGVSGIGSVHNCIVWENENGDINSFTGVVANTCSSDGVTNGVNGCITSDPLFANAAAGNFQLLETSPCLDRGDNAYAPAGKDLSNSARIINGTVDLGAYERFEIEADGDADGIPNWWELSRFGGITNAPALQLSSNGVNTIREAFIAGIDPNDPLAKFVAGVERVSGAGPVIRWPLVHGRVYSVYWTPDLLTPFTLLQSDIPWTPEGFIDRDHGEDGGGFYKIDVRLDY